MNVTIDISEETARIVNDLSARTGRTPGDILREWIDRSVTELPIEMLSDEQVLVLCDLMMSEPDQTALSELLADQREGLLTDAGRSRLAELLDEYQRGMVRKSEALRVAVQRGLRPPLG